MLVALLTLLGGLGIVLHGLHYCSEGLQRSAGQRLKGVVRRLTKSPMRAAATGAILTGIVQSSTAVTVMLVGLANAGLVTLSQATGIILGADAGTTLTVQLLAFDTGPWSLGVVALGYILGAAAKRRSYRYLGQSMVGIGLVFFGLKLIGDAIAPLREAPLFAQLLATTAGNPLLGLAIATAFTALVHSSAATLGLAMSLAAHGALTLPQSLPLIMGANIGTCATALLSAAGTGTEARRVAAAHTVIKIAGALALWPLAGQFAGLIRLTAISAPRQIANAHTAFNLSIMVAGLIVAPLLVTLIKRILPETLQNRDPGLPVFLDRRALETPVLALEQASQEIGRVGDLVLTMLQRIPELLTAQAVAPFELVAQTERSVDRLFAEISAYLGDIGASNIAEDSVRSEMYLLHIVSELEHAGDTVFKISLMARKRYDEALSFSTEGLADMLLLHRSVCDLLESALAAYHNGDAALAGKACDIPSEILSCERQLRETHLGRLTAGLEVSRSTSAIHLDILSSLQRLADHAGSIAFTVQSGLGSGLHSPVQLTTPVPSRRGTAT